MISTWICVIAVFHKSLKIFSYIIIFVGDGLTPHSGTPHVALESIISRVIKSFLPCLLKLACLDHVGNPRNDFPRSIWNAQRSYCLTTNPHHNAKILEHIITHLILAYLIPRHFILGHLILAQAWFYLFIYLFSIYLSLTNLFQLTIRLAFQKQEGLSQTSIVINNITECWYGWHQTLETESQFVVLIKVNINQNKNAKRR